MEPPRIALSRIAESAWRRLPEWIGLVSLLVALAVFVGAWLVQEMIGDAGIFRRLPGQVWIKGHAWLLWRMYNQLGNHGMMVYLAISSLAFTICYVRIVRHILEKSKFERLLFLSTAAAIAAILLGPLSAMTGIF
jgi:hypothetical protein